MAPVKTGYGNKEGAVTEAHIRWYRRHARYVGAVTVEPMYLADYLKELPTQIGIDQEAKISELKKLTEVIHNEGAKAIAHLNHPGRLANPKISTNKFYSSSAIVCSSVGVEPKEMTKTDIQEAVKLFSKAAKRAEEAEFDIIELQFGHGYLVGQFLSPHVNKRTDEYGGNFENRIRFALEVLRAVKESTSLPIIIRISADEMFEDGWRLEDTLKFAPILEQEGVSAIHVSAGSLCETTAWYFQHMFIPKKKTWQFAKEVKKHVSIPIIAVGQINTFEDVDEIKNNNMADYIALGREMIADPKFVPKYQGIITDEPLRSCAGCLDGCLFSVKNGKGLQCVCNPEVSIDYEEIRPAQQKKNYAIIGGGIAGLQAALTLLKYRGHDVTIYEKGEIGGQLLLASLPPGKAALKKLLNFYIPQLKDRIIRKEPNVKELEQYDGVIIATGSRPIAPPFECDMEYHWADIMLTQDPPNNKRVVIVGGGLVGIELAAWLSEKNNDVVVIELLDEVARDMNPIEKTLIMKKIEKTQRATIMTGTKVTKAKDSVVYYIDKEDKEGKIENVDILVVAIGLRSNTEFLNKIKDKIPYWVIGDANKVGTAFTAIRDAFETCKKL